MHDVQWTKSALDELAAAWVDANSTEREAITAATVKIDEVLKTSSREFGESRSDSRRIGFVPPLGMAISVDEGRRRVKVLHVWLI